MDVECGCHLNQRQQNNNKGILYKKFMPMKVQCRQYVPILSNSD
jgi:hypothetical protein